MAGSEVFYLLIVTGEMVVNYLFYCKIRVNMHSLHSISLVPCASKVVCMSYVISTVIQGNFPCLIMPLQYSW